MELSEISKTFAYDPNDILSRLQSGFGVPNAITDRLRVLDMPSRSRNWFNQWLSSSTRATVIVVGKALYGRPW